MITHAWICGLDGNIWASISGVNATVQELSAAINVAKSGTPSSVPITLGGLKYTFVRPFDSSADFKGKSEEVGGNPANAFTVAVTDKAAVVALHQAVKDEKPVDGMLQKTNLAATKVRDYLKSQGY